MENKSIPAYASVLSLIKIKLHQWIFTNVICDFEDAMIVAFRNIFNVQVQECHSADVGAEYINLCNFLSDKYPINKMGFFQAMAMQAKSRTYLFLSSNSAHWMCCALPLLPPHLLQRGLNAVGVAAMGLGVDFYTILRPYLCYIQESWLEHPSRGPSLFVDQSTAPIMEGTL